MIPTRADVSAMALWSFSNVVMDYILATGKLRLAPSAIENPKSNIPNPPDVHLLRRPPRGPPAASCELQSRLRRKLHRGPRKRRADKNSGHLQLPLRRHDCLSQ